MLKTDKIALLKQSPAGFLRAFAEDEEGGIIILTLLLLIVMLVVGGMAVDFMRFESERAELQSVSDRAVLAAAELNQTLPKELVVKDYFKAAGFENSIIGEPFGSASLSDSARTVGVKSAVDVNTFYLRLIGIDELNAPALSTAVEGIGKVEVSLVLDISGSMRNGGSTSGGRFFDMQNAAKSFAANILKPENDGQVSLTIVPYAGSTNPGPAMFAYLNGVRYNNERLVGTIAVDELGEEILADDGSPTIVQAEENDDFPNVSSCLELLASDFADSDMPGNGRAQVPHFMNWPIAAAVMDWGWCPHDRSAIRYAMKDYCEVEQFIDGIRMHDGTGTHYGIKYGLAALDPRTQPAFAHLSAIDAPEWEVNPAYTPSAACDPALTSVGDATADAGDEGDVDTTTETPRTLVPVEFSDRPALWTDGETKKIILLMTDGAITDQYRPTNVFDARNLTSHISGDRKKTLSNRTTNRDRFYDICDQARDNNVAVYTVAFETSSGPAGEMRNCATVPAMFYPVAGDDLTRVFNDIAEQISELRLSQ